MASPANENGKGPASESQQIAAASADNQDSGWQGKLNLDEGKEGSQQMQPGKLYDSTNEGPKMAELRGSRASIAGPAADKSRRAVKVTNPGSIPTAGGVAIGERQTQERRASRVSGDLGKMPPLDKQGSPDATTQENTVSNTMPQGGNGEGSSRMAPLTEDEEGGPKDTSGAGAAPASAAPAAVGEGKEEQGKSTVEKAKEAVSPSSSSSSPSSPTKERRGSRFDDLKQRFKIGK